MPMNLKRGPYRKRRSDRTHLIYLLTNVETGEQYIGLTAKHGGWKSTLLERFRLHCSRAKHETHKVWPLLESIRSHGPESFDVELLDSVRGKLEAHSLEREWIRELNPILNEA